MSTFVALADWSAKTSLLLFVALATVACLRWHVRLKRLILSFAIAAGLLLPFVHVAAKPAVTLRIASELSAAQTGSSAWQQVWLLGIGAAVVRLLLARVALFRVRRSSKPLPYNQSEVPDAGLGRTVELRIGRRSVDGPLTFGLLRPVILLPGGAEDWPKERLRAVILHELAHIRSLDEVCLWLAHGLCALQWFNPMAWLAGRALRTACEEAADAAVIESGARPSDYASLLLSLAASGRQRLNVIALPMAQRPLERRIRSVLGGRGAVPLRHSHTGVAVLGFAALVTALSSLELGYAQEVHSTSWLQGFALGRAYRAGHPSGLSVRKTGLTPEQRRDLELRLIRDRHPPR